MILKRVIICAICVVLAVAMIAFALFSLFDNLPKEGKWKGVITQYKQAYQGQLALIILFLIVGHIMLLIGVPFLCMTIREEFY